MQHRRVWAPGIQSGAWWGGAPGVNLPPFRPGTPGPPPAAVNRSVFWVFLAVAGVGRAGAGSRPGHRAGLGTPLELPPPPKQIS